MTESKVSLDLLSEELKRLEQLIAEEKEVEATLSAKLTEKQQALADARAVQGSAKNEFESKTKHIQELQKQLLISIKTLQSLPIMFQPSNLKIIAPAKRSEPTRMSIVYLIRIWLN